nr:probable serine/threonine-protein kinase MPS1 isoform X1 [Tanacetum cinerariifolium]
MDSSDRPVNSDSNIFRDVQAAFKRPHRMITQRKPMRLVVRGETAKTSDPVVESHSVSLSERVQDSILRAKNKMSSRSLNYEAASVTPPDISGKPNDGGNSIPVDADPASFVEGEHGPLVDADPASFVEGEHGPKKVQFALQENASFSYTQPSDHMETGLTKMECDGTNPLDVSTVLSQDITHQKFQNFDVDRCVKTGVQDQITTFRNFLQSDFGHNLTQSSTVGSSCATTTLVNPEYAPLLSSTTHCSCPQHESFQAGEYSEVHHQDQPIDKEAKYDNQILSDRVGSLFPTADVLFHVEKRHEISKDQLGKEGGFCGMTKDPPLLADVTDIQSQAPMTDGQFSNVKTGPSKSVKKEKADASKSNRKRNYDPDLFFKVNGKLYQRLGKIGSGGSSEVHKVISQDCTIYALKKIKLKGRDYGTAFGFCQEIEYLNKLKGKDHIIQLIDYEVTDKALLKEVMSGSVSNTEGKVKDDGYIYMVLEYGEIDLANMLSHKWKELDKSKSTIDENWLRFYWQQILLAVKTIHEKRIVHSDLKPANFLLVRGSLKLIDFGIAKAIMSDTTNIQRDSQVGTLSYMSPEAFMCNETDADGNIIKCGRPSDIWSLGCILYQMVYGRTPFADYKTFWAKFKVVTDPDFEIPYEPVSNPCLLDLMKKCLSWDRNKRWRIPELLQHPFLAPPIPSLEDQDYKLIKLVSQSFTNSPKALALCNQLERLLMDPLSDTTTDSISVEERSTSTLLYEMSKLCVQLKELATSELDYKR